MRSADAYFEGQSGRQANAARFQVGRTPAHHYAYATVCLIVLELGRNLARGSDLRRHRAVGCGLPIQVNRLDDRIWHVAWGAVVVQVSPSAIDSRGTRRWLGDCS